MEKTEIFRRIFGKEELTEEELVKGLLFIEQKMNELTAKYREAVNVITDKNLELFIKILDHADMFSEKFIEGIIKGIEGSFNFDKEEEKEA